MASRGQLVMEDMLKDVQSLVEDLRQRNEVSAWLLGKGNVITDKLAVMKEYNNEVNQVNAIHAPEGRANLVAGLQHESRQIQALQEENRQMEYAINELERGMEMIMARHREIVVNCKRSDKMLDLLSKLQLSPQPQDDERVLKMAKLVQECIEHGVEEDLKHREIISQLLTENNALRKMLKFPTSEKIDNEVDQGAAPITDQRISLAPSPPKNSEDGKEDQYVNRTVVIGPFTTTVQTPISKAVTVQSPSGVTKSKFQTSNSNFKRY